MLIHLVSQAARFSRLKLEKQAFINQNMTNKIKIKNCFCNDCKLVVDCKKQNKNKNDDEVAAALIESQKRESKAAVWRQNHGWWQQLLSNRIPRGPRLSLHLEFCSGSGCGGWYGARQTQVKSGRENGSNRLSKPIDAELASVRHHREATTLPPPGSSTEN